MKKTTCVTFESILNTIQQKGITTKAELMADHQLYNIFGQAALDYVKFCLASKSGKTTKAGKKLRGNTGKVDDFEDRGITTREDIAMDCVANIVKYIDNMLTKTTVAHMKNYAYTIVNTTIHTSCRNLPPKDFKVISLDGKIKSNIVEEEDSCTLGAVYPDYTYDPERVFFEKETIKELKKVLKAKLARELAEKKESILHEIAFLSKHPAELMVRMACTHLSMKPRELASLIIDKGCELAYAEILFEVAKQNRIGLSEIRNIIADHELTAKSVKADTNSAKQVASQIYRLGYRADKRLNK